MKSSCIDVFDSINCKVALDFCDKQTSSAFRATGEKTHAVK